MRGFLYFGLREYGRFFPTDKEAFSTVRAFFLLKKILREGY